MWPFFRKKFIFINELGETIEETTNNLIPLTIGGTIRFDWKESNFYIINNISYLVRNRYMICYVYVAKTKVI